MSTLIAPLSRAFRSSDVGLVLLGLALGSLAWGRAGISILGALAVLVMFPTGRRNPALFRTSFVHPFLWLVMGLLLSALCAPETAEPWKKLDGMWPLLFLFLTTGCVRISNNPVGFVHAFLLLASLGGVYSIASVVGLTPPHPDHFADRHIGPTHIMAYSVAMATALPVATDLMLRTSGRAKMSCLVAIGLTLFGLVATEQRAYVLVGCLIAVLVPILHFGLTFKTGLSTLACLLLIPVVLWLKGGRLEAFMLDPEVSELRLNHWRVAWDSWLQSPVWGHGLGSYVQLAMNHPVLGDEMSPFVQAGHFAAHNFPLHVLATQGLIGIALFAWLALALILPFLKGFASNHHACVVGIISWLLMAGTSITDTPFFQSARLAAFTLLTGYAYGCLMKSREGADQQ